MSEKYPISDIFNKGAIEVTAAAAHVTPQEKARQLLDEQNNQKEGERTNDDV